MKLDFTIKSSCSYLACQLTSCEANPTGQAGDPAAARDMFAELVPASGRALGPEHPDTLMARLNLATFTGGGGCGRIPGLLTKLAPSLNRVLRPEQRPDPPPERGHLCQQVPSARSSSS